MHATFCKYFVFHEFRKISYMTLAKYLGQKSIRFICVKIFIYGLSKY